MRIVLDMQGAQTESRLRGIERYTISLAEAIVKNRGEHEIILVLNGLFTKTVDLIRTKVLRLQESKELHNIESTTLSQVISGVSPDYAVIAKKQAPDETRSGFDELFAKEYGLSLETLANKFENRLTEIEIKIMKFSSLKQEVENSIIWKLYKLLNLTKNKTK